MRPICTSGITFTYMQSIYKRGERIRNIVRNSNKKDGGKPRHASGKVMDAHSESITIETLLWILS